VAAWAQGDLEKALVALQVPIYLTIHGTGVCDDS
jgi:hypothetical protein